MTAPASPALRLLPAGSAALLAELPDLPHTLALFDALQAARQSALQTAPHDPAPPHAAALRALHTLVPAARTVLLEFAPHQARAADVARAVQAIAATLSAPGPHSAATADHARRIDIPVRYDGQDLAPLAERLGISAAELADRHSGSDWQAAFAGFAPGFVYLSGGHPCFHNVPRLATPRTRVPAGAVALAGHFSAVYPKDSPGGWQLIGSTPLAMWDLTRAEPALVQPGFRVRFAPLSERHISLPSTPSPAPAPTPAPAPAPAPAQAAPATLHILSPGLQTLFQDAGRRGMTGMGVSASGALDGGAMRAANRCVGNPPHAAVLENTLGQLRLRCQGHAVLAVGGAHTRITVTTVGGARLHPELYQPFALDDGDVLDLAPPEAGLRCYLAVRGGLHAPQVLGSAATDTLAQIGPAPLRAGDAVAVGARIPAAQLQPVSHDVAAALHASALPRADAEVLLDLHPGPRDDWFTPDALALLGQQPWQASTQSNRVGIRLNGHAPLTRAPALASAELPSEGTVTGALQVPASGQPVLFLADHPLTGGYPVIAVLAAHHLDLAAQIPPGARLRFRLLPRSAA